MILEGKVIVLGDDVNTDIIYPGKYLTITNRADQSLHVMEGFGEHWPSLIKQYPIIVAGWNFGCGSSREQAATALMGAGVRLVIASSFSRLFLRNCINNGLPVIESENVSRALSTDDLLQADLSSGHAIINGKTFSFEPLPPNLIAIVQGGGLLAQLRLAGAQ